ncbi:hypothetical protein A4G24_08405 [Elizabethkingia anophelis]|nr:hypothetical protein A4G24_08405 [Elizabethkingia anophelis]
MPFGKITKLQLPNFNFSDMSIQNAMNQLMELKNDTIRPIQSDFIKHLVSVSVLLIPLTSFLPHDHLHDKGLFHWLLISLLTCILSGSISLYIVLIQHRKMAEDLRLEILRMIDEEDSQKGVVSKYNYVMKLSEILCVLSFLASVILIVIIAW